MRKVIQISDLHFGKVDKTIAEGLIKKIDELTPDLVIVSGDLTQRARRKEFSDARDYLSRINYPKIVTAGNHDIPLFDVFRRFLLPLQRYKRYITSEMSPLYLDSEIIVLAINTARSFTWKNGRISLDQISEMEKTLCPLGTDKLKIVVTHHPFIPPPGDNGIALVGRSGKALEIVDRCCVDLLLAGHLHQGYSGDIRMHYPARKRSVISVQAGTAISSRIREKANAFNLLHLEKNKIHIEVNIWDGSYFSAEMQSIYNLEGGNWNLQQDNKS
jgi:3',5'-cyclic AMP phosphodiesterase CpdA